MELQVKTFERLAFDADDVTTSTTPGFTDFSAESAASVLDDNNHSNAITPSIVETLSEMDATTALERALRLTSSTQQAATKPKTSSPNPRRTLNLREDNENWELPSSPLKPSSPSARAKRACKHAGDRVLRMTAKDHGQGLCKVSN